MQEAAYRLSGGRRGLWEEQRINAADIPEIEADQSLRGLRSKKRTLAGVVNVKQFFWKGRVLFLINLHGIRGDISMVFHEKRNELRTGRNVELPENPADMSFYGLLAQKELGGDLFVLIAFLDQVENLLFPFADRLYPAVLGNGSGPGEEGFQVCVIYPNLAFMDEMQGFFQQGAVCLG